MNNNRLTLFAMALLAGVLTILGIGSGSVLQASAGEEAVVAQISEPTFEDQVMELVNQARWDNGNLPPLKRVDLLDNAAESHSANMAGRDFFAHCDLDTKETPWDRMVASGYQFNSAAENIAAGYNSPQAVISGWMASSGHRANILSTNYRELGIGHVHQGDDQGNVRGDSNGDCDADSTGQGPYFHYWTQNFGRRNQVYPVVINREAFESNSRLVMLYTYGQGWASEMHFRNEDGEWSPWEPFAPDLPWTLSDGGGLKTVHMELRNGATVYSASDTIILKTPENPTPTPGPSPTPFPWVNPLFLPLIQS